MSRVTSLVQILKDVAQREVDSTKTEKKEEGKVKKENKIGPGKPAKRAKTAEKDKAEVKR